MAQQWNLKHPVYEPWLLYLQNRELESGEVYPAQVSYGINTTCGVSEHRVPKIENLRRIAVHYWDTRDLEGLISLSSSGFDMLRRACSTQQVPTPGLRHYQLKIDGDTYEVHSAVSIPLPEVWLSADFSGTLTSGAMGSTTHRPLQGTSYSTIPYQQLQDLSFSLLNSSALTISRSLPVKQH